MFYSRFATFTLAIVISSIQALPTSGPSSLKLRATTEIWSIPRLDLHMMTRHSGLPGGGDWPESFKYLSTIDFDIAMPNNQNMHCHTESPNGTLPEGPATCTGEGHRVGFTMNEYTALGPRRKELSFVLQVFRVEDRIITMGNVAITANDPKEPSSYLTCFLGAPFDGLRCKSTGGLSYHKDLEIVAHTSTWSNTSEAVTVF